jgi:hypothetical protein
MADRYKKECGILYVKFQDKVVGHLSFLITKDKMIPLFVGYDRDLNGEHNIYFNIVYRIIELGISLGKKVIKCGQTTDFFKQKSDADRKNCFFCSKI